MRLEGFEDVTAILRAGVYALCYRGQVVYVGKSKSMYSRIYTHKSMWAKARKGTPAPSWIPVKGILFDEVHIIPARPDQLDQIERAMINRYKPKHNIQLKTAQPISERIPLRINGVVVALNDTPAPQTLERRI